MAYQEFASRMHWPSGSAWGRPVLDYLSFSAMLIGIVEAWATYGIFTAFAVAVLASFGAFALTLILKQRIQMFNVMGITAGSIFSLLGPDFFQ
jgi:hypothetical protein